MKNRHVLLGIGLVAYLGYQCTVFADSVAESNFGLQLERIKKIAESKGIIRDMGQEYVAIDGSQENGVVIVHYFGGGSNDKYEIVTPIIDVKSNTIYIDCSYGKSYNGLIGIISVDSNCRGKTEATSDFFEIESKNSFGIEYSSSAHWLKRVRNIVNCKSPVGLVYSDVYIIRCQEGGDEGLTENITITALSSDFSVLFILHGYEFFPIQPLGNVKILRFIGLKRESHYEILEMNISPASGAATYRLEKVRYSFLIDEGKPAIVKQKNYLYKKPNNSDKTNKYLIAGDKVTVDQHEAGFCQITYTGGKQPLQMWIMCDALEADTGKQ
jgi:hypothetical protein